MTAAIRHAFPVALAGIHLCLVACSRDDGVEPAEPPHAPPKKVATKPQPPLDPYADWPARGARATNEWEQRYLAATGDEERIALLDEKLSSGPEFLATLIRRALREETELVRIRAIEAARYLTDEAEIHDLLGKAIGDSSPNVAILAIERALVAPEGARLPIIGEATGAPHAKVREMAISQIAYERKKSIFPQVFRGLDDPDDGVRLITNKVIYKKLLQRFANGTEAQNWWAENASRFNAEMVLLDRGG